MRLALVLAIVSAAWCEEAPPSHVLRGRVVDLIDGMPIPGATVRASEPRGAEPNLALTDDRGVYSFLIPVPRTPTHVRIAAEAPSYAPVGYDVVVPPGAPRDLAAGFRLPPGVAFSGTVVDADGRPATDVRLAARRIAREENGWDACLTEAGAAHASSDARGEFSIDGIGIGDCLVEASSGGRGGGSWSGRVLGGERIEIRLWPPREAASRVTRDDGGPVAGLDVDASGADGWSAASRTDADGGIHIVDAPPGAIEVRVLGKGADASVTWQVTAPFPESVPLDRVDRRRPRAGAASIRGVVIHAEDHQPVAGVDVGTEDVWTVTNEEGVFFLDELAEGRHEVYAEWPETYSGKMPYTVVVEVAQGQEVEGIEIEVSFRPLNLSGRLVDEAGRPVVGAKARLLLMDSPHADRGSFGANSERSLALSFGATFSMPIESGHPYVSVSASHPTDGWGGSGSMRVDRIERTGPLTLVLHRPVVLRGVVRDPSGRGIAGVVVEADAIRPRWKGGYDGGAVRESPCATLSDSEGRYLLLVEPVPTAVSVFAPGYHGGAIRFLPLAPGSEDRRLDLVLKPGGTVKGRTRRPDGTPVPGRITATSASGPTWAGEATADSEGAFEVVGVPQGVRRIKLRLDCGGAPYDHSDVEVDGPSIDWTVE